MNTIYATFADPSLAEKAAGSLLDIGVRPEDISLVHDRTWVRPGVEMVSEGSPVQRESPDIDRFHMLESENTVKEGITTTTPEDASAGAAKGAGIGLGIGVLAALASITIPGFGLVTGGGALATAIAGAAATAGAGAIAGGMTGYLRDQGVETEVARELTETISSGGAILTVEAPSNDIGEYDIRKILHKYGVMTVNSYVAVPRSEGYLG